jgi:hypothetical protein
VDDDMLAPLKNSCAEIINIKTNLSGMDIVVMNKIQAGAT